MSSLLRLGLPFLAACAVPDDLSATEQESRPCHGLVCGFNSPEMDHNGFHELAKDGTPNDQGFAIKGLVKAGLLYQLDVSNGELSGTRSGSPRLDHAGLVGAEIHVERGRDSFRIRVARVGTMPYFSPPADPIETYVLEYGRVQYGESPTLWTNVCGGRWVPPEEIATGPWGDVKQPGNPETYGQVALESILFDLDRFDLKTMTLNSVPDPGWFNIGCAGHTLSKLHLTHNTIASQGAAHAKHWAERQATLKMLTADYCGDGTPFTVAGQRLDWQGGGVEYYSAPLALEARWTENGAACLDTPRMTQPSTPEGAAAFPDIEGMIALHCARPRRCRDHDPLSTSLGYRTSALR